MRERSMESAAQTRVSRPQIATSQAGFALVAAIFSLLVVGVLVVGGVYMAGQEARIGQTSQRTVNAFYLAEHGLNQVLQSWSPGASQPKLWQVIDNCEQCQGSQGEGVWQVRITRTGQRLYFVESTAEIIQGGALAGARHAVGQMARRVVVKIPSSTALMTRDNVVVRGTSQISGFDRVPAGWGDVCADQPLRDQPGVITDTGNTASSVGAASIEGSPSAYLSQELPDSPQEFFDFQDIDWDALEALASHRITPPGTITQVRPTMTGSACNKADLWNWGDPQNPSAACGNYFPLIYLTGPANIAATGMGQGILMVDGDLEVRGGFEFRGLVLVRGQFSAVGSGVNIPRIVGSVIAFGGAEVGESDDTSYIMGAATVQYSSCAVLRTLENIRELSWLEPLRERGWTDLSTSGS